MFDFRYHVASLAAVFFALVIGILVGVRLRRTGSATPSESGSKKTCDAPRARPRCSDATSSPLKQRAQPRDAPSSKATYKSVMANRLKGKKIARALHRFVGEGSSLGDHVGAGRRRRGRSRCESGSSRSRSTRRPRAEARRRSPCSPSYAGPDQLENLGHDLGQEFVAGTDTPLWSALQSVIVEEKIGPASRRRTAS